MTTPAKGEMPDLSLLGPNHVERYRETDGEVGYIWNGVPTLLLTTTGRKSGKPRTTPLIFGQDGDDFVIIASMGGAPLHPQWYRNIEADPDAEIQVKAERIPVTAHVASGEEKARLWRLMADLWPNYDAYQERTERVIPVVVLTRRS